MRKGVTEGVCFVALRYFCLPLLCCGLKWVGYNEAMAFYLKYRPQKIGDLDLPEVRETLYGLLAAKSLPHALLCTGIRGTGKTSSARILAKAINCEKRKPNAKKPKDMEPCNECDACVSITKGRSMDVVEIDAASHRGIDDIRDLREKVKLAPTSLTHKVYIIDEVHMLTTEAFNALLKTLEEPPEKVLFVLCTTELGKLPDTVVSRCVRVPFRRAQIDEVIQSLRRVVNGEEMDVEDNALAFLAELGDGSFRDATKYLEEVSWMDGKISREKLEQFYHMERGTLEAFIEALHTRSVGNAIEWIEERVGEGVDVKRLAKQILERLHNELMILCGVREGKAVFTANDRVALRNLINLLDQYWWRFGATEISQLPLELAVLEWMEKAGGVSSVPAQPAKPQEKRAVEKKVPTNPIKTPREVQEVKVVEAVVEEDLIVRPVVAGDFDVDLVKNEWETVMQFAKKANFSIEALLRAATPARVESNKVILEVAYSFHRDKLQEDGSRRVVEKILAEALGRDVQVWCELAGDVKPRSSTFSNMPSSAHDTKEKPAVIEQPKPVKDYVPKVAKTSAPNGKKVSKSAPVPSEEDEELVKFAEDLFGE